MPPPTKDISHPLGTVIAQAPARPTEQAQAIALWICAASAAVFAMNPAYALLAGIVFALTIGNAHAKRASKVSKYLLQASVVGLGFGIKPGLIVSAGLTGIGATAVFLMVTLGAGWVLAKWLQVEPVTGALISCGTAICGGSAIAVMGPIFGAEEKQMSISLLVVFLLNAIALFLFPLIGNWAGMEQQAFGLWAAMAIHDTSSVAGAAAHYGSIALGVAVAVKLARALWILPMAASTAVLVRRSGKNVIPWFVLGFLAASALASAVPLIGENSRQLTTIAKAGLAITLFLIGTTLSKSALKSMGWRPLVHAVLLWIFVAALSFGAVKLFAGYLTPVSAS